MTLPADICSFFNSRDQVWHHSMICHFHSGSEKWTLLLTLVTICCRNASPLASWTQKLLGKHRAIFHFRRWLLWCLSCTHILEFQLVMSDMMSWPRLMSISDVTFLTVMHLFFYITFSAAAMLASMTAVYGGLEFLCPFMYLCTTRKPITHIECPQD